MASPPMASPPMDTRTRMDARPRMPLSSPSPGRRSHLSYGESLLTLTYTTTDKGAEEAKGVARLTAPGTPHPYGEEGRRGEEEEEEERVLRIALTALTALALLCCVSW